MGGDVLTWADQDSLRLRDDAAPIFKALIPIDPDDPDTDPFILLPYMSPDFRSLLTARFLAQLQKLLLVQDVLRRDNSVKEVLERCPLGHNPALILFHESV